MRMKARKINTIRAIRHARGGIPMSSGNRKNVGTKVVAWCIIGAMLLTFVFSFIIVLMSQFQK